LKDKLGYKGLIITDALNMGAVAISTSPENWMLWPLKQEMILCFSLREFLKEKLIQKAIDNKEIPQSRVEESVKKILLTKYFLGLTQYSPKNPENINTDLNNDSHKTLVQNLYSNALTY
jgi:beta-glucosidase-like glycosyl hydrolase